MEKGGSVGSVLERPKKRMQTDHKFKKRLEKLQRLIDKSQTEN